MGISVPLARIFANSVRVVITANRVAQVVFLVVLGCMKEVKPKFNVSLALRVRTQVCQFFRMKLIWHTGKFQSQTAQGSCSLCQSGKYSSMKNRVCINCPTGQQNNFSQFACHFV
jgi:hypothetical protein